MIINNDVYINTDEVVYVAPVSSEEFEVVFKHRHSLMLTNSFGKTLLETLSAKEKISRIIKELYEKSLLGRKQIERGDSWRDDLTDKEFTEIVPLEIEDDVIGAMFDSGFWQRSLSGWNLKIG